MGDRKLLKNYAENRYNQLNSMRRKEFHRRYPHLHQFPRIKRDTASDGYCKHLALCSLLTGAEARRLMGST